MTRITLTTAVHTSVPSWAATNTKYQPRSVECDILDGPIMFRSFSKPRRVVITGFGCVTPIGIGREAFWQGLDDGRSGVRRIESFDVSHSSIKIAAEIPEFDWKAQLNPKDRQHVPRTVPLALAASREAVIDSGIDPGQLSSEEMQ